MQWFLIFFLFALFSPSSGKAQDTLSGKPDKSQYDLRTDLQPVNFEPEKIEDYKADKDFAYLETSGRDNWWTRFKRWVNNQYEKLLHWLFGDYEAYTVIDFILRVLPYVIIGAVIMFVVWLFIRLDPENYFQGEPEESEVFMNDEEEIIRSQNIPQLIEEAVQQKNYRLAIRYYYLLLLKELNRKELINYESQKTNSEYLNEIKKEEYRQPLKNLMRIYDFSWYGGFSVSENHFLQVQKTFAEMESRLKGNRNG